MLDDIASMIGMPLHPLVVDAGVVLLPLVGLGALLMGVLRAFSRRFAGLVVVGAWAGVAAVLAASVTGQTLADSLAAPPEAHLDRAGALPWIAVALAVLITVFWLFDRGIPGNRPRPWWLRALGALLVVGGLVAAAWVVQVGYSGALAAWSRGEA